jgi:hypothetical protein
MVWPLSWVTWYWITLELMMLLKLWTLMVQGKDGKEAWVTGIVDLL